MSSMIREWSSFQDSNVVLEYKNNNITGSKDCYLKGIMIQGDTRNLNERVYPSTEISNAVTLMQERLKRGESILCECDHPETLTINLERVAGMITDVWMEGNNGIGVIKLLPTKLGTDLRVLLENGVKLGVSSRGSGNVDHNGFVSDFEIVTVDIVAQPSAPDAYPTVVFESLYNKSGVQINKEMSFIKSTNKMIGEQVIKDIEQHPEHSVENEIYCFFKEFKG